MQPSDLPLVPNLGSDSSDVWFALCPKQSDEWYDFGVHVGPLRSVGFQGGVPLGTRLFIA